LKLNHIILGWRKREKKRERGKYKGRIPFFLLKTGEKEEPFCSFSVQTCLLVSNNDSFSNYLSKYLSNGHPSSINCTDNFGKLSDISFSLSFIC
jgi:hypothetical protein